jgi:hypothetical protein
MNGKRKRMSITDLFHETSMKKCMLFFGILFLGAQLEAANPNVGTSGAKFLMLPVGARAAGLAGAYTGMCNDASAPFWNPAGLVQVEQTAVHFSYMRWFDSFDLNAASVAYNAGDLGTIALSALTLTMDKMEITTEASPNGTGRYFDAQDMALGISYARFLTTHFSTGITLKYVYQKIWNETADGIAFDLGTQYHLDFQNMIIAMSMTNFGSDLRFEGPDLNITHLRNSNFPASRLAPGELQTDAYPLPLHFQVGIGMDLVQEEFFKARAEIDATHPNDNTERINAGTELVFFDRLYLRGGYRFNYDDESFTFGAGVNIPFSGSIMVFDYAMSMYDILPDVHRISLGIAF